MVDLASRGAHERAREQKMAYALLRDRAHRVGGTADRVIVRALQAELHRRDVARIERAGERVAEGQGIECGRGDQIEPAAQCRRPARGHALPW